MRTAESTAAVDGRRSIVHAPDPSADPAAGRGRGAERGAGRSQGVAPAVERVRWARVVSAGCAVAVVIIGVAVLSGWALRVGWLKTLSPGAVTVKPNAALAFVLTGLSLIVLGTGLKARRAVVIVALLAAAAVAAIGLMTLAEYVFGSVGIDQLLFHDSPRAAETVSPGRMSVPTALALIFCSAGLVLAVSGSAVREQLAASAVLVIGFSTVLGYLYGITLSRPEGTTATAAASAAAILLSGIGLVLSRPGAGPVAGLLSDEPGGLMGRWLLGTGILLLPILGGVRLVAQQAGLYSSSVGVGIMVVVALIALGAVVALTANRLNLLGRDRTLALHRLSRSEHRLRRTLYRLLQVREEERRDLAIDLHDDALPALAAVRLQLELARDHSTNAEVRERLQRAEGELRDTAFRLRHLMFDLLPEALASEGLAAALQHRLERMHALDGVQYELDDRSGRAIPAEPALMLYRSAVEALRNVARHAQATRVRVELERLDRLGRVTITDDGVGFAPAPDGSRHLGLQLMSERAEQAGGRFEIGSCPEGGTRVVFEVPLDVASGVGLDLS